MERNLEERLKNIEEQLAKFGDVIESLGRDIKRPVSAIRDGYYEAALTNAGSIIEAMLKDIWAKEKISGKADAKTIEQLFSVVKEQANMDRLVQDYIRDIQLVRNRAAHGEQIVIEDCIESLRKLSVVLEWYFKEYASFSTASPNVVPLANEKIQQSRGSPRLWLGLIGAIVVIGIIMIASYINGHLRSASISRKEGKPIRSIAVLPLENYSSESKQDYFADGMTDALIIQLAKISGFEKVISRTSVMQYKGARRSIQAIGRELNVDALLEGSVQREGKRVRINVQLIDAGEDRHLWAETYERDIRDILILEGEIAQTVARKVYIALTPSEINFLRTLHMIQPD